MFPSGNTALPIAALHVFNFSKQRELKQKVLLSFGAESFVFQVAIQKFKDQDM